MKIRISLIIPLLLALSTLVSGLLMYYQAVTLADTRIHRESINKIQLDIGRLQNILYNRLTAFNLSQARLNISVSAMDPSIHNLLLVDENDNILISNRYIWEGNPASSHTRYDSKQAQAVRESTHSYTTYRDKNILQGYFPIILLLEDKDNQPQKRLGMLFIEYSIAAALGQAKQEASQQVFTFAGVMLIVTAIVAMLLHFLVSKRLNILNEAALTLARGELDTHIDVQGKDELAELGNSFNDMAQRIQEDIEARKIAEKALHRLNDSLEDKIQLHTEQLQESQRIARLGNWITDLTQGDSFWSDELFRILGCEPGELLPTREVYLAFVHHDDLESVNNATNKLTASNSRKTLEYRIVRADGETIWVQSHIVGKFDQQGQLTHLSGVVQDITEKKVESEEREKLQLQLQHSQKMETLGQLTGGIAHDFNNMLTSISGFTQLAQLLQINDKDNKLSHYLDQISKVSERAKNLVAQMLAFSRIDKNIEQLEQINLNDFIQDSIAMLRPLIPSSIELKYIKPDNEYYINANSVMLSQVILNLCVNARDAIEEGKGSITIEISQEQYPNHICSSCHHSINGEYIAISVRDSGPGIPGSILDKLFEPFFTTKEVGQGSGMGLSIVHGIIHRHNGHILVSSSSESGTTIQLLFEPIEKIIPKKTESDKKVTDIQTGSGKHILIVDDDPAISNFLTHLLEAHDYQVTAMNDGVSALEYFKQNHAQLNLVVTDQTMPRLTGVDMAKQMLDLDADIPIIICTGFSEHIDEKRAQAMNIKAFLNKPYQNTELLQAIERNIR